jgi:Phage integrase, N-terminal SAM-like domain
MKSRLHKNNTVDLHEAHIRNHIIPTFGASGIASIRPTMVQQRVKNTIDQQVIIVNRHPALASRKTSASLRDVPMPRFVLRAVKAHAGRLGLDAGAILCRTPRGTLLCPRCAPVAFTSRSAAGQKDGGWVSRPVGRVLCPRLRGAAVIHLGLPLPTASCGLPASIGRAVLYRSRREPLVPLLTLLRVGFTEPPQSPAALVVSYTAFSPLPPRWRGGGLFSVALSRGSPRVGVTDHPALWSPDLPHRTKRPGATARPTHPRSGYADGRLAGAGHDGPLP